MFYDADISTELGGPQDIAGAGLSGFLVWLRLWLECLCPQVFADSSPPAPVNILTYQRLENRADRRNASFDAKRALPAARDFRPFLLMGRRGVSCGQFTERLCRFSVLGRVHVYGLSRRGRSLKARRARRLARAMARSLRGKPTGLWAAHLWPN